MEARRERREGQTMSAPVSKAKVEVRNVRGDIKDKLKKAARG